MNTTQLTVQLTTALEIGPYRIFPVPTGHFGLDGGAMFGTVPKALWQKSNPADEQNRILMEAKALFLVSKDRRILIDTGNGHDFVEKYGEKLGSKFASLYNVKEDSGSLEKSLHKLGFKKSDITDVLLTHLHFDHAGGATEYRDGMILPTFPNARYYVQKRNLELAQSPNLREKASYLPANFQPLLDAKVLELIDSDRTEVLPGIEAIVSHGHTSAQQVFKISDTHSALFYCADVIPTSSHVRIPWLMGYDLNPLELMKEKSQLMNEALKTSHYLFFEHDPYCDVAVIEPKGEDFQVKERFWLQS